MKRGKLQNKLIRRLTNKSEINMNYKENKLFKLIWRLSLPKIQPQLLRSSVETMCLIRINMWPSSHFLGTINRSIDIWTSPIKFSLIYTHCKAARVSDINFEYKCHTELCGRRGLKLLWPCPLKWMRSWNLDMSKPRVPFYTFVNRP